MLKQIKAYPGRSENENEETWEEEDFYSVYWECFSFQNYLTTNYYIFFGQGGVIHIRYQPVIW